MKLALIILSLIEGYNFSNLLESPCPNILSFSVTENHIIGSISLIVPKVDVRKINVTITFGFQRESKAIRDITIDFVGKNDTKQVIETVLTGKPVELLVNYDQTKFDFKEMYLNGKIICQDSSSKNIFYPFPV